MSEFHIERRTVALDDGRTVQLFVNCVSLLVTLDIVDADEEGGVEVYRAIIKEVERG